MVFDSEEILSILDDCCEAFTFPMLDNGYDTLQRRGSPLPVAEGLGDGHRGLRVLTPGGPARYVHPDFRKSPP